MPAQPEALILCSHCPQRIAISAYESHLRQAHSLFAYRGFYRCAAETIEVILYELITTRPSTEAWRSLRELARDRDGVRAPQTLAEILSNALSPLPDTRREQIGSSLVPLIAEPSLAAALAERAELASRSLALSCLAVLPTSADVLPCLAVLLRERKLPLEQQIGVLARFWPRVGDRANELLDALVEGVSRARGVNALRALERQTGPHPAISSRLEEAQEKAKLSCPRCGVELKRAAMEQHLWDAHKLILDGLKMRDPWSLLEEWLEECKASNQPELLARCRIAATKLDPDGGQLRLARLSQARGLPDPEAKRMLLELAREKLAACCPSCYGLVPIPVEVAVPLVNLRPGRLSWRGYEARTDERGMRSSLEVRMPAGPLYQGYRPEGSWTIRGISTLLAVPMVALALLFACLWPVSLGPPIRAVACFLGLGALAFSAVRLFGAVRPVTLAPLVRYVWKMLVPKLCMGGFIADDALFMAGFARVQSRVGFADVDLVHLGRITRLTEQATTKTPGFASSLAELHRLRVEKEAERGNDPVPLVAALVGKTFEGQLPLAFAQRLLEEWSAKWWTPLAVARLRVLLCDRAFEAGFEVQSLLDAGQTAPALGTVLNTSEPRTLAALRLLWSLRATRPWDKLGDVKTAFELAREGANSGPLVESPDLLLYGCDPTCLVGAEDDAPTVATIRLTTLGVWLQRVLFRIPPREVEVRLRSSGGQLILGQDLFRSPEDLDGLSRQLEKWFRYSFHEFLPSVDRVLTWQPPERGAILRAWGAVPCPECGKHVLPRVGEVGITLEDKEPRPK